MAKPWFPLIKQFKLPRCQLLAERSDFTRAFMSPRKVRFGFLVAYVCKNTTEFSRVGVVIGKRNIKLAVKRNRLRRMLREGFRLNQHLFFGFDIVIVVCRGVEVDVIKRQQLLSFWHKVENACAAWASS